MKSSIITRLGFLAVFLSMFLLAPSIANAQSAPDAELGAYWAKLAQESCTFCEFSGKFVQLTDTFARKTFLLLAPEFAVLTSYVFSIYFLIQCAKLIVPFGPVADGAKIIWETIVRMIAFFFVMWALTNTNFLWDGFYKPAVRMSMKASEAIITNIEAFKENGGIPDAVGAKCGDFKGIGYAVEGGLDKNTVMSMTCQVEKMEEVSTAGMLIGWQMMSNTSVSAWPSSWPPAAAQFLAGALLLVLYFFALVTFPFFYIDLVFRMGLICALMPVFLFGFVFPWTRRFLSNAVQGILASLMTLVCSSTVFAFAAVLMTYAPMMFQAEDGTYAKNLADMIRLLEQKEAFIHFLTPAYQFLLVSALVALILSRKVSSVVQTIFEFREAGPSMAAQAQGILSSAMMMAGGATMVAAKVAAPMAGKMAVGATVGAVKTGVAGAAGMASLASPSGSQFQQYASNLAKNANPLKNLGQSLSNAKSSMTGAVKGWGSTPPPSGGP